jgi:phage shock protein B
MTQWKRARGLSVEDERLLDELHDLARRLDDRLGTIERIVAADHPNWRPGAERPARPLPEADWPGHA